MGRYSGRHLPVASHESIAIPARAMLPAGVCRPAVGSFVWVSHTGLEQRCLHYLRGILARISSKEVSEAFEAVNGAEDATAFGRCSDLFRDGVALY